MDKIKTVKIKLPDGSVSEETYTISVDARDVDMKNGKDLQDTIGDINVDRDGSIAEQLGKYKDYDSDIETLYGDVDDLEAADTELENDIIDLQINKINKTDIVDNLDSSSNTKVLSAKQGKVLGDAVAALDTDIKKKAYFFDTVAAMKAANLKNGEFACTLGYYAANDGGAADYKIVSSTNNYKENLNNGLFAELIVKNKEYNLLTLGLSSTEDKSNIIQSIVDSLGDNITLIIPAGIYFLDLIIKNKYIKLQGSGTIKGSITLDTTIIDNILNPCYNEISGINFTKNINNYAIKLNTGRNFKINNISIDESFEYGVYYNTQSSFSQRVCKAIISNNIIYAHNGVYLSDTNTLGVADITFDNNILYSTICNVYLDGVDGFKDTNNTYFMEGYNRQSQTKTYNFKGNRITWLTINGSTFFEAGYSAIYLTKYQNTNINNNLIGWCGQRVRSAGIYLGDYDVTGNGLYNLINVSNNIIMQPSGNGIEVTTNTGRVSINNNRLHGIGSSQYYYGAADSRDTYGIYYPLVNENMYCNVTNNICENKISSLSTRIFKSNNIEPNSKSTAYRLTENVEISDTFVHGIATSKTLSYSVPTGYLVNNIRVISMDPTSHAVQYDITIVGNIAIIKNNYSTDLTTKITFQVEYIKADSFI